jgi:hypothetical protein
MKEGGKKRKLSGCDEEEQEHLLIRSDKTVKKPQYCGCHFMKSTLITVQYL